MADQLRIDSFIELESDEGTRKIFFAYGVESNDPEVAIAAALQDLQRFGDSITDIGPDAEDQIVTEFNEQISQVECRIVLVMDLSNYPYIMVRIDDRDQRTIINPDAQFSSDVINIWSNYDPSESVPVIIINTKNGFAGLKLLNV